MTQCVVITRTEIEKEIKKKRTESFAEYTINLTPRVRRRQYG